MLINGERLKNTMEEIAEFGQTRNGGVTRLALSEEDRKARDYFRSCCENLGMSVKIDDVGNMYATLAGIENHKPPIVIGSHLDSVKKGGRFDGVLGVIAGLEVARTLVDHGIKPQIPLVVANFTNEEGARFEPSSMGSGILSGIWDKSVMMKQIDIDGITFEEALNSIGYAGEKTNRLSEAKAYLELHVEQGPILDNESIKIGVVECVIGMVRYNVEVVGESSTSASTPMSMRKDAMFAANNLITEARKKLSKLDDKLVYTIGRINVFPNIPTVIPNKVVFSIEARHKDIKIINQAEEIIQGLAKSSDKEECKVTTREIWKRYTTWFDKDIAKIIEQSAKTLGYSQKRVESGTGHDARTIASYIPSAMIFVPSIKGKSHSEDELTTWEDCEKGVNVLLRTILELFTK